MPWNWDENDIQIIYIFYYLFNNFKQVICSDIEHQPLQFANIPNYARNVGNNAGLYKTI